MIIKLKKRNKKNEKHDKKLKNTLISWWENTKSVIKRLGNIIHKMQKKSPRRIRKWLSVVIPL